MLNPAPAGPEKHGSAAGHGWLVGLAVARTTCFTSSAFRGSAIWPRPAASLPSETMSAATPACVGVPVDVDPSLLGTENSACGPYDVRLERDRKVLLLSTHGQYGLVVLGGRHVVPTRVEWSPVRELPGHTCA